MNKRRKGKIARLPKEVRDQVCVMIRDGRASNSIIAELALDGVNEQNITNWVEGGYAEWLHEQERLEDFKFKREFALTLAKDNEGSKVPEAALIMAAGHIYEVLAEFDLQRLKDLLDKDPENFPKVINSLAKLSKGALDIEKYKEEVRSKKESALAAVEAAKKPGGLTKETLALIEEKLKLL